LAALLSFTNDQNKTEIIMKWVAFDPHRYIEGIVELTLQEVGAYQILITHAYARDGDLPDNPEMICRMLRCHGHTWRAIKAALVAKSKIEILDGKIVPNGVQNTLKSAAKVSEKQSKNSSKRWQKFKKDSGINESDENWQSRVASTTTTTTTPTKKEEDILRSETGARDGNGSSKTKQMGASAKRTLEKEFSEFYEAYPKKKAKKAAQKAYEKARRDTTHAAIMAGLARAIPTWNEPQYIPYPATWLNRGCWDDDETGNRQPSMLTLSNGAKVPMPNAPKGLTGSEYAKWYHDFCEKAERQHAAETHTH